MRKDLGRCLVGKGKHGKYHHGEQHRSKNRTYTEDDLDNLPSKHSSRGLDKGHSNYTRNPLRQAVINATGQKWDKVNSEIRAGINFNNELQANAYKLFIDWDMALNVAEIKKVGKIKVPHDAKDDPIYDKIWVHPKTGIIMKPVRRPVKIYEPKPPKYIEIKGKFYRYFFPKPTVAEDGEVILPTEGHWFEIELKEIPTREDGFKGRFTVVEDGEILPQYDYVLGSSINNLAMAMKVHGRHAYATGKRQLGSNEIKKLKLYNTFAGDRPEDMARWQARGERD